MKVLRVVNFPETKRRFDESGRGLCKFCRVHGFASTTFSMLLRGVLPYSRGENYDAMIQALRDAGCLVEEDRAENEEGERAA